jgi:hypothetical protein
VDRGLWSVPPCHGAPEKGEDREKPFHHDERCEDCLYLQVVENRGSLNILTANPLALPAEIPIIKSPERLGASITDAICAESSSSPPSRQVLRI